MNYKIGKSSKANPDAAVTEATSQLKKPQLLLFFSGVDDFTAYAREIKTRFPDAVSMGATTFAAFCKDGAYKDSLLVIGFEDGIVCEAGLLKDADKYPLKYVEQVEKAAARFNKPQNTICLEFSSALISCEELVLSTLNAVLSKKKIPVFGGSSGDRGRAEKTIIALNGQVYQDACVFVMIENLGGKIRLYRENIYKPTRHYFKSTKVDVRKRIVYEYDHKPAASVMAAALGVKVSELPKYLDSYPLGRIIGNEMFIVANNQVVNGSGMEYHARIYNNSQMVLLEPDDYQTVLQKTLDKARQECSRPSLTLMVNCLARSILFESNGELNQFATTVGNALGNYVGFAGYGEQLNEQHFNQTMVLAVFE
ncbi:FIST signal transduction protein [Acetobacterium wieringae]|uniref:FIST signal transduction protein n=1 Tax=Acetobacterium wieringae TaxID=52694 RepID=UPI002033DAD1|nr:FIST N-terminal domain-containing protein [Acetobacterium wieringae]URN82748.1 FIST C-terminal domain-containing protein [Acetobacterium wieringae]